ncbi:MAG: hypothetical protein O7C61_02490, partial [SAR324 cluster bacterium]|nr:hypothetical protein [SAR324 cluster bacterium]
MDSTPYAPERYLYLCTTGSKNNYTKLRACGKPCQQNLRRRSRTLARFRALLLAEAQQLLQGLHLGFTCSSGDAGAEGET